MIGLKLSLVALLVFASSALARPYRSPDCIEGANPFDDPCFKDIRADVESVSLLNRDGLISSNGSRIIQFADTFTHTNRVTSAENSTVIFPDYPQGLALSYPGFAFFSVKSTELLMPSPPQVLITDSSIQDTVGRQSGIIRQSNTSSFDLRSLRFACTYHDDAGQIQVPSCLVTLACQPMIMKDTGTPSGHRPTSRPMISSTFEFLPNLDQSSLTWSGPAKKDVTEEDATIRTTLYADADLGDDFYDLDHCYIILDQYSSPSRRPNFMPAVLIDDVIGVAYYDEQETAEIS